MVPQSTKIYLEFQVLALSAGSGSFPAKKIIPLIKKFIDKEYKPD
jgi:hypothetical protein